MYICTYSLEYNIYCMMIAPGACVKWMRELGDS